jgi:hypothetical protein
VYHFPTVESLVGKVIGSSKHGIPFSLCIPWRERGVGLPYPYFLMRLYLEFLYFDFPFILHLFSMITNVHDPKMPQVFVYSWFDVLFNYHNVL